MVTYQFFYLGKQECHSDTNYIITVDNWSAIAAIIGK